MTRIVIAFALLALIANAADPTASSASLTSGSFAALPGSKVIDATTTTAADYTTWYTYEDLKFGPGADNGTIYAYGIDYTNVLFNKVISRALNATLLSNGTAATAVTDAKIGSDGVFSPATTTISNPVWGIGLGSMAAAYVIKDSSSVPCAQLVLTIVAGGASSATVTKTVTSNVCTLCTAVSGNTGVGYVVTPHNVFYENGTYYVSYSTTKFTDTSTGTACTAAPVATGTITTQTSITTSLQGVNASSAGDLKFSTVPTVYTSTSATPDVATLAPSCGPSNLTASTNIYCVYKNGAAAGTASLILIPIGTTSGTVGNSVTIAADTTTGTGATLFQQTFTLAGFSYSLYQQGVFINNLTTAGATPTYTNNLNFYNLTSGAATQTSGGTIVGATYTNSIQTGVFKAAGITYGTGYAVFDQYISAATDSITTFEWGSFLSNSTVNTSKVSIASVASGRGNHFVDANGAVWFGAWTADTTTTPPGIIVSATVGKLISQIYSAGNILASFFALLSVMIAAVFAF